MSKKVCVITSTRADYSLLKPVISLLRQSDTMKLQLIVTGSHLSGMYGNTYKAIEEDGFFIDEKINILADSSKEGIGNSMGLASVGFSATFKKLKPDLIVLLGDRYEIFIAAGIATVFGIPIAHIHGGEITTGAIDDAFRHSITKMSSLHFTAAQEYKDRVIQMGENPALVFNTGSLAVDSVKSLELLSKEETEEKIGLSLDKQTIIFTYHPETLSGMSVEEQTKEVLSALSTLSDINIIMTKSNADAGGLYINNQIDQFVKSRAQHTVAKDSLGQLLYYSAVKYCSAVVGNSSSGILETPIFKTPTVNIGNRQNGRIMSDNIISVFCNSEDIVKAIRIALSSEFCEKAKMATNPFEGKDATIEIIKNIEKYLKYK